MPRFLVAVNGLSRSEKSLETAVTAQSQNGRMLAKSGALETV